MPLKYYDIKISCNKKNDFICIFDDNVQNESHIIILKDAHNFMRRKRLYLFYQSAILKYEQKTRMVLR